MKKCLSNEKIEKFVNKQLTASEIDEIKKHISKCRKCYDKYIEYKELLYFKTKSVKISKNLLDNIINFYDKATNNKKPVKRYSIIIKSTKQAMEILTDSNFELKSDFISAAFIVKGDERKRLNSDIITLIKLIDSYKVELKIEKLKGEKFKLSVFLYKKKKVIKKIRVFLLYNKQEIESIILPDDNQFKYKLIKGKYLLRFTKDENILFEIELKIKND